MFENYTYKIKFKVLLVLFIVLSIAAYRRSFSNLIQSIKENNDLSTKIETVKSKTKNSNQLISEVASLDKLIGKEGFDKEKIQQEIVEFLLKNSNNVSINDMQPVHEYTDEIYKVTTYQIDLVGNFNNLVSVVYKFERDFDYSKLVSLKFYTSNKNNKKEVLHLKIIFQKYENNK